MYMKNYVSIAALLLCINAYLHSMEQKKLVLNNNLTEETFGNIQEQIQSTASREYSEPSEAPLTKIGPALRSLGEVGPGLMDEILLENKNTLFSPTYTDV